MEFEYVVTLIPGFSVLSQNTTHRVTADVEMPGKRPDRPPLLISHHDQLLLQVSPVSYKDGHGRSLPSGLGFYAGRSLAQRILCMTKADQGPGTTTAHSLFLVGLELAEFGTGKQDHRLQAGLLQGEKPAQERLGLQAESLSIAKRDYDIVFGLKNRPTRVPQDCFALLFRTDEQGCHHFPGLPPGKTLLADRSQEPLLVAALQPGQLRPYARRKEPQPDAQLRLVGEPLDQGNPPADPALVASHKKRDLNLVQAVFMAKRMHHQGLLHHGDGPAHPVELQHGCLAGPQAHIQVP